MKIMSRTISETLYTAMCVDITKATVFNQEISLGSVKPRNTEHALNLINKAINNGNVKAVSIVSRSSRDVLYVMTEESFIRNAFPVKDLKEAREILKAAGDDAIEVEGA